MKSMFLSDSKLNFSKIEKMIEEEKIHHYNLRKKQRVKELKNHEPLGPSDILGGIFPETIFENVAEVKGRIGFHGLTRKDYVDEGPVFLSVGDLKDDGLIDFSNTTKITIEAYDRSPEIKLNKDDILFSKSGTIGKVCIFNGDHPTTINAAINIIRVGKLLNPRYVYHWLKSPQIQKTLLDLSPGSAQLNLYQRDTRRLRIPIPPINIQEKIVEKLDSIIEPIKEREIQILSNLEKFKKSTSPIPQSFKNRIHGQSNLFFNLKNKIIEDGFSGILSESFRKNKVFLPNWFEDVKIQINEQKIKSKNKSKNSEISNLNDLFEIPKEWVWTNISSLETMLGSGSTPSGGKSVYVEEGIPFIRSQNVLFNKLELNNVAHIPKDIHSEMSRTHVYPDDVLLNITGASIGRSTSVSKDFDSGNVNQHVCIIRTGKWINPDFLSLWLNSLFIQKFIDKIQKGGTKEGLNSDHIRSIPIPLTIIEEQDFIIKEIEKKFLNLKHIQEKIDLATSFHHSTLMKLEKLSQSISYVVFSGKL